MHEARIYIETTWKGPARRDGVAMWLVENREHFDLTAFCDKKIKNMLTSCFTCGIIYRHSMEMGL